MVSEWWKVHQRVREMEDMMGEKGGREVCLNKTMRKKRASMRYNGGMEGEKEGGGGTKERREEGG